MPYSVTAKPVNLYVDA